MTVEFWLLFCYFSLTDSWTYFKKRHINNNFVYEKVTLFYAFALKGFSNNSWPNNTLFTVSGYIWRNSTVPQVLLLTTPCCNYSFTCANEVPVNSNGQSWDWGWVPEPGTRSWRKTSLQSFRPANTIRFKSLQQREK